MCPLTIPAIFRKTDAIWNDRYTQETLERA